MPTNKNILFLPLTEDFTEYLSKSTDNMLERLKELSIAEAASVYLIQHIPALPENSRNTSTIQFKLSDTIKTGQKIDLESGESSFTEAIAQRFDPAQFKTGLEQLIQLNIRLMEEKAILERKYISTDGSWDFNFSQNYAESLSPYTETVNLKNGKTFSLTSQQSRLYRTIETELDEDLNIQALAGTGKTFLASKIIDTLERFNPLVIAYTDNQLAALKIKIGNSAVQGLSFGNLARWLISRKPLGRQYKEARSAPSHQLSPEAIAKRLHFFPVNTFNSAKVAHICTNMVRSFCYGRDHIISIKHIPNQGKSLTHAEQETLVRYATILWEQTAYPDDISLQLPLRGYHSIKQLSLETDIYISPEYTHIVIDEAHELPLPLAKFLERCTQPVIMLGDSCQNTEATIIKRPEHVRQRELYHSVRAGRQTESVINPLLDHNPIIRVSRLQGSRDHDTKIIYYEKSEIPEDPTTILVNSEWGMLEWFQRLGNQKIKFSLLLTSASSFIKFAKECIELYHNNRRSTHSALFRFTEWSDVRYEMREDPSFIRINRMFEKGYSLKDFNASLLNMDRSGNAPIKIGKAFDAKNMEFDSVMLAPDLLARSDFMDKTHIAKAFSALYIGSTRARSKLILPGDMKDWVIDSATTAK